MIGLPLDCTYDFVLSFELFLNGCGKAKLAFLFDSHAVKCFTP